MGIENKLIIRYKKMLELIKNIIEEMNDDNFIFDRVNSLTLDNETYFKSEVACLAVKIKCERLLKEIGEIE